MNEKIQELETLRQESYKKIKTFNLIGFPSLALMIVFIAILGITQKGIFVIFVILAAAVGAFCLFKSNQLRMTLVKKFKDQIIPLVVQEVYPGAEYNQKAGMTWAQLDEPGFFKDPDRYTSSDYLKGVSDGVPFEMCAFDLKERHETTDSEGHTTVTYETYAKGKMIVIDFKRDIMDTVKVVEVKYFGQDNRGLHKIKTESIDFNKKFTTLTSNDLTTFYILTPQIQLKLLEIEQKFSGSIFFSFHKGKFYAAINDSKDSLDIKPKLPVEEQVQSIVDEISIPAAFINELKLSGSKFNSDEKVSL